MWVELLGIVNQQDADPGAFGCQQLGVGGERLERGPDKFGGPHRRSSRPRRRRSYGRAQQHHLLVSAREPARGRPFRTTRQPSDPLELLGVNAAFGATGQQLAQLGGEPCTAQGCPQLSGPRRRRIGTVGYLAGKQFGDDRVLFSAGHQPGRRTAGALGRQPQHRERVAVHAAHQRLPDHRPKPVARARPHLLRAQQRRRQRATRLCPDPT